QALKLVTVSGERNEWRPAHRGEDGRVPATANVGYGIAQEVHTLLHRQVKAYQRQIKIASELPEDCFIGYVGRRQDHGRYPTLQLTYQVSHALTQYSVCARLREKCAASHGYERSCRVELGIV